MTRDERRLIRNYVFDTDFRIVRVRISHDGTVRGLLDKLAGSGRGRHPQAGKWTVVGTADAILLAAAMQGLRP